MSGPAGRATGELLPVLRVTLFGTMRADDATGRSVLPRGRKTRALLAVLALSPHRIATRSQIAALLWGRRQKEQAQASLRQAVHELQQALAAAGPRLLHADRNHLALAGAGIWIDTAEFCRATQSCPGPLELFREQLVEDLQGLDPAFDEWRASRATLLRQTATKLAETFLNGQHEVAGSVRAAEQVLRIDRTHQAAWQALIHGLIEQDDHAAASAAYERCRSVLAQVAGAMPSREILRLAAGIRRSALPPSAPMVRRARDGHAARFGGPDGRVRLGVFPFRRVDHGTEDALAVALAQEITAALAQFRWMTCVAKPAVAEPSPAEQASWPGPLLPDLDFLLDGTIQRSGTRVRIIVQLSDIRAGGTVVWAQRFDRDINDIFALQDEIAAGTAAQLDTALLIWEGERVRAHLLGNPDAVELTLGAIPSIYRLEKVRFGKAGDQLETALTLDPSNAAAHAWLAYWHLFQVGQGWAPDPVAAARRAAELAERAVALDARDARAMTLAGHVRGFLDKRPEEARALHERAIALNPNLALSWCFSGLSHSYLGDHAEARRRISHAQRLAPHDPHGFFFDTAQIMPNLLAGQFEAAAAIGRRAIALNPGFSSAIKGHLSALGHLGRESEAAEMCRRLQALEPGFCVRDAIARSPMVRETDITLYADGLRRAGLPE